MARRKRTAGAQDGRPPKRQPRGRRRPPERRSPGLVERRAGDELDPDRGVYMISVAAELAGMHPQTLRIYETRGLITPKRSAKNTRLYSQEDVERLRRIQELTTELGMNLAGVEKVFELEQEIARMRRRMRTLQREAERVQRALEDELDRVRRSTKRELVVYEPPSRSLLPAPADQRGVRIPIHRGGRYAG